MTLTLFEAGPKQLGGAIRTVLVLGAGFSKWSCDLPLVSQLFDFNVRIYNAREESRINRLIKLYSRWQEKNPTGHNEAFIQFCQNDNRSSILTNWYITRRLTEPFTVHRSRRYTWYMNSYHPTQHVGIQKARGLIRALNEVSGVGNLNIVTTNYDLIPEYALTTRGFNYGVAGENIGYAPYPYPQPVHVTGEISISKLHGSLSWTLEGKFPDSRHGLTGKCLIVPPIMEKEMPELLKSQWDIAGKALNECRKLLVFGFSFNEHDLAIRNFFKTVLSPSADVILVDVVDHRSRLQTVFGSRNVNYINAYETDLANMLNAQVVT